MFSEQESTFWDSLWLKNRPNLTNFETKLIGLVGSQSVVWFSNFTKTCKSSFMKRGTKVLCDKRSRCSDHFAHQTSSEQASLRIEMILTFVFQWKCTRNPSKNVSGPIFPQSFDPHHYPYFIKIDDFQMNSLKPPSCCSFENNFKVV